MWRLAGLLGALAQLHGLIYAFLIPPWQAPDEIAHFEYSNLLAQDRHTLWYENESPAPAGRRRPSCGPIVNPPPRSYFT